MTTRAERLDKAAARALARLEVQRKALTQIQAAQYAEEKKAIHKRQLQVGRLVLDTPLAGLDDTTLAALFAALSRLVETPDPVGVVEGLLREVDGPRGTSLPGCAHPADGVAPPVPV